MFLECSHSHPHYLYLAGLFSFSINKFNVQMVWLYRIFDTLSLCIKWKIGERGKERRKGNGEWKNVCMHTREVFLNLKYVLFFPYQCAVLFHCSAHTACNKLNSGIVLGHTMEDLMVFKLCQVYLKSLMRRNILFLTNMKSRKRLSKVGSTFQNSRLALSGTAE